MTKRTAPPICRDRARAASLGQGPTAFQPWPALAAALLATILLMATACGTLRIGLEKRGATEAPPPAASQQPVSPTVPLLEPVLTPSLDSRGERVQAYAWYGQVYSVAGAEPGYDYLKLWHLNLWPKFGRAVGLAGADPAVTAEIERIRDKDVRATFWGELTCGVADYGSCQLLVTRLTASDGGPTFTPDPVEAWTGTIGRLSRQPGSQDETFYFNLAGEVPVLYAITSQDPALLAELEWLAGSESSVRIWGQLHNRVNPLTGSQIVLERLQAVSAEPSP